MRSSVLWSAPHMTFDLLIRLWRTYNTLQGALGGTGGTIGDEALLVEVNEIRKFMLNSLVLARAH